MLPAFDFINDNGEQFGIYLHIGGRSFIEQFQGHPQHISQQQSYRHCCLEVDDIQATASALRQQGIDVSEVKMGSDKSWQAWLSDPDGNRIELHQYTPESKQNISFR